MRKGEKIRKANRDWMLTYSDMVTLILVFFIAIITSGKVKVVKTRVILSTFTGNIGLLQGGKTLSSSDDMFVNLGKQIESLPSERSERNLEKHEEQASALFSPLTENRKRVRMIENQEGIVISLFSDIFFEKDSAKVNRLEIKNILENINLLLNSDRFEGDILIEGHTDNMPYQGSEFSDNWELSMARALSVMKAIKEYPFVKPIKEDKISLHAYGDTRPIEDNNSPIQRAYNRRVDIVLKRK